MVAAGKSDLSLPKTFGCSAFAACVGEICTIPLDTAKVRLQLQKSALAGDVTLPKYRGLLGTVGTIAREEGLRSLWKGVVPGLHRQCLFGGLRIGMYEPVKNLYVGKDFVGDVPLSKKILAGLTTGALGIMVANPTDLVKVRLQAEGKLAAGAPRRYSGALNAYSTIVRQEGVRALWTGLGPNVARNAIINAAELASYDQVKETILKIPGFTDKVVTHILSGLGAGFFAVCIGSPVDVRNSAKVERGETSEMQGMWSQLWRKYADYKYNKFERFAVWEMIEPYRRPKTFTTLITIYVAAFYTGVIGAAVTEQLYKEKFWEEHPGKTVPLMKPVFYRGPWRVYRGEAIASDASSQ